MSKLSELPKTSSITQKLTPEPVLCTPEIALANKDNIIHRPRILTHGSFSYTLPEERKEYRYLLSNPQALHDLGLDPSQVEDQHFQHVVSGQFYQNKSFLDQGYPFPYAQAYAGWQFGQFAGQLGDGRVVNLFEIPKPYPDSTNRDVYEIQLKGAGKTPFSRFADGKAVLRSSIREYIISEHLNAIGIPTTRALSITYLPKTMAQRTRAEKCAIVARFAESWIRLGNFDLYRWRSDRKGVKELSDYVIDNLFTINGEKFANFNNILKYNDFFHESNQEVGELTNYDKMFFETVVRNAETAAKWQCYGFLNGVLNTDNTSILGLSTDFGPFSIMDRYNPNYSPNSEDHDLRYSYKNSPTAIWWNLTRFGEDLAELIGAGSTLMNNEEFKKGIMKEEWEDLIIKRATKIIEIGGEIYEYAFNKTYSKTLFNRLGLSQKLIDYKDILSHHKELFTPFFDTLFKAQCDFNKVFLVLQLADYTNFRPTEIAELILAPSFDENDSQFTRKEVVDSIISWLNNYYNYVTLSKKEDPNWSRDISKRFNPLFLPRNWILEQVIEFTRDSDANDLSYLKKVQAMSSNPFDPSKWGDELKDIEKSWLLQSDRGADYSMLQCSCSS
jgi:uncharacterized protein YdiU (UPF0061 family)